jgi:hypothetical protein
MGWSRSDCSFGILRKNCKLGLVDIMPFFSEKSPYMSVQPTALAVWSNAHVLPFGLVALNTGICQNAALAKC